MYITDFYIVCYKREEVQATVVALRDSEDNVLYKRQYGGAYYDNPEEAVKDFRRALAKKLRAMPAVNVL